MIRLPRGKAIKTGVDLRQVDLEAALKTLQQGRFTGYLRFDLAVGDGAFLFSEGKLIEALYKDAQCRLTAGPGFDKTIKEAHAQGGQLDIYRVSVRLTRWLEIALGGVFLLQEEPVHGLNIKAILSRMADEERSGCLRVSSERRVALIFFEAGQPVGFFHEDCDDLTTDADVSLSVARDAGACLDVLIPVEKVFSETVDLLD